MVSNRQTDRSCHIDSKVTQKISSFGLRHCYTEVSGYQVPPPPVDSMLVVMTVWRLRGKIIRTTACCVVYDSRAQRCACKCEQFLNSMQLGLEYVFVKV